MKRRRVGLPPCEAKVEDDLLGVKDTQKLEYACKEVREAVDAAHVRPLSAEVLNALEWVAQRSSDEIIAERNRTMWRIRSMAKRMRDSGATSHWFRGSDAITQQVAGCVNGPLFEQLVREAGHVDLDCVEMFRKGARMVGVSRL